MKPQLRLCRRDDDTITPIETGDPSRGHPPLDPEISGTPFHVVSGGFGGYPEGVFHHMDTRHTHDTPPHTTTPHHPHTPANQVSPVQPPMPPDTTCRSLRSLTTRYRVSPVVPCVTGVARETRGYAPQPSATGCTWLYAAPQGLPRKRGNESVSEQGTAGALPARPLPPLRINTRAGALPPAPPRGESAPPAAAPPSPRRGGSLRSQLRGATPVPHAAAAPPRPRCPPSG